MLSARSDAEFCRNEAARLAAMRRRRASCRCLSGRSRDFSLVITVFCRAVFFGTGAGGCRGKGVITDGSCTKLNKIYTNKHRSLNYNSYKQTLWWGVFVSPTTQVCDMTQWLLTIWLWVALCSSSRKSSTKLHSIIVVRYWPVVSHVWHPFPPNNCGMVGYDLSLETNKQKQKQ